MEGHANGESNSSWFSDSIEIWANMGWEVSGIEQYLSENPDTATEALLRVEYLVNLSSDLRDRLNFEWLEKNELFSQWLNELQDPMKGEIILQEYEEWAKSNRPWELILVQNRSEWDAVRKGEEMLLFLARCDSLDPSSHPQLSVLIPMFKSPEMAVKIDHELSILEQNEARQKRTIFASVELLKEQGYDAEYIIDLPMIEALEEIAEKQRMHTEYELLRLQIIDKLSPFDDKIAEDYEKHRLALIGRSTEQDLIELKSKISSISDDLHQRLSDVNDQIFAWREKGIIFSHDEVIRPDELMQWETNLPELENSVSKHLHWLERYRKLVEIWPDENEGHNYLGYLENTDDLIDVVENLLQKSRQSELESLSIIERFQNLGLVLDGYQTLIQNNPKIALDEIKQSQDLWQQRVDCIEKLLDIDTSFEGEQIISKRVSLLREIDAGPDIIEDTILMIENSSRRRARHRRMLESDLLDLIKQGKASEDTISSRFNLLEFENFLAHSRKFGTSNNASLTGNSAITSTISERLEVKLSNELSQYQNAGWYVNHLLDQLENNPIEVAKILANVRPLISNHDSLRRRLTALPWSRDVKLAIQVQEELQDPLKLSQLASNIPTFMKHLSSMDVEDSEFTFVAWKPKPIRKTLLPIPESIQDPKDTLEDAHEAILDAMDEQSKFKAEADEVEDEPKVIEKEQVIKRREIKENPPVELELNSQPVELKPKLETVDQFNDDPMVELIEDGLLEEYSRFLLALGLSDVASNILDGKSKPIDQIRKSIAPYVGVEPRDMRIDRMLRIALRLIPKGEQKDQHRKAMLTKIISALHKYKKWMKARLEARHSSAKGNFLEDAKNLGIALNRIPGPGFAVPLTKDEKSLPNSADIESLFGEVETLINSMDIPSASGVVVEAN
ncbi:MAG: hypothetical protein CMA81_03170 [Euryarchaeota archaeon]|nr:hypothetical protein [Euryarchaeota archaeon]